MKANLSKIYWPMDVRLYTSMKRLNREAIAKFTNHPYAVKKVENDTIQDKTAAQAVTDKTHSRSLV